MYGMLTSFVDVLSVDKNASARKSSTVITQIRYIIGILGMLCYAAIGTQLITFEMEEEKSIGFLVGILYKHLPDSLLSGSAQLTFRLLEQGHSEYFIVEPMNGRIETAKRIDRETFCPINSIVQLEPVLNCKLQLTVNLLMGNHSVTNIVDVLHVTIYVIDINDNPCVFYPETSQTIHVKEDVPLHTKLLLHSPSDQDTGDLNGIDPKTIRMVPINTTTDSDLSSVFMLDMHESESQMTPYNLELVVRANLDYEKIRDYFIQVEASQYTGGKCSLYLRINVMDVNDNSPKLLQRNPVIRIQEWKQYSEPVFNFTSVDEDVSPLYRKLFYAFDPLADFSIQKHFRIDRNNGSVYLISPLDFSKESVYHIPVIVSNYAENQVYPQNQPFTDKSILTINVIKVDDNRPVISVYTLDGEEQIILTEHSMCCPFDFAVVTVADRSVRSGDEINCHLTRDYSQHFRLTRIALGGNGNTNKFTGNTGANSLQEVTFKISALKTFDREIYSTVSFGIACVSTMDSSKISEHIVHVRIRDINDNAPHFNKTLWSFQVTEDSDPSRQSKSYLIGRITAIDFDEGLNSKIVYRVLEKEASNYVTINENTGVLSSTGMLDRESDHQIQFTVIATDSGEPKHTGSTRVNVTIMDYNDNAPMFDKNSYTFSLEENHDYGAIVGVLRVSDRDEQENARLHFYLDIANGISTINNEYISAANRNRIPFNLVSKHDALSQIYLVTIYATQIIDREFLFMNASIGNSELIRNHQGEISYNFVVVAEDDGKPRLKNRVPVQVLIRDVNDHSPRFKIPVNSTTVTNVSYKESAGQIFLRVYAFDPDQGLNGSVQYSISNIFMRNTTQELLQQPLIGEPLNKNGFANMFEVHPIKGLMYLVRPLGPEYIGKMFTVELTARDLGSPTRRSSTTTVHIRIDNSEPDERKQNMNEMISIEKNSNEYGLKSNINFYIILAIMITAFVVSGTLMFAIWWMLHRRRQRNFRKFPEVKLNGSMHIPMGNIKRGSNEESRDSRINAQSSRNRSPTSDYTTERLANLEICTGYESSLSSLDRENLPPLRVLCPVQQIFTANLNSILPVGTLNQTEPLLLCTRTLNSSEQATLNRQFVPCHTSTTFPHYFSVHQHPTQLQHQCTHTGETNSSQFDVAAIFKSTEQPWIPHIQNQPKEN